MTADLPPLLVSKNGSPVRTADEWLKSRRAEVWDAIVPLEYGGLPPAPQKVEAEWLSVHYPVRFDKVHHSTWRLVTSTDPYFAFILDLWLPAGASAEAPCPMIVDGDGCWSYISDEVKANVLSRGNGLAIFNRCEIAADRSGAQDTGLYRVYPGAKFGALAAWAWGYHRVIDFLVTRPEVDAGKIVATGHSRGGKVALLAGATDTRIAITNPNNSGCGGAGCFRHQGSNSERLADILRMFPFWFSSELQQYVGRERELPFDQHFLKALVAPRDLLTTEALGDLWANPSGTFVTHKAAQEVYALLDAKDHIGVVYREGPHAHRPEDWTTLLDYMDYRFRGKPFERARDAAPNV